ncbi:DUF481 domain-containing protein [Chrysiogenes arsenatis]|uniref:DUF481 domain-containing protein n=1 Tax=Chrysiogenes arsenatis TaxID=309797 RepID=UPI00040D2D1B|nr:DUF481 domain-containing protein [Chrysiogenes arsenatis]
MRRVTPPFKSAAFRVSAMLRWSLASLTFCLFAAASAQSLELTPEYIRENYPDLYRQIQSAPKLPPQINPEKPYGEYQGFFSHPTFQPNQPEEWWEHSSFEYSPEYPYFLKHTHLKFSFAELSGNDDGTVKNGGMYLGLRKGRFTNHLAYSIDKKEIQNPDGNVSEKDVQNFEETLQYELNRYLFAEAGLFWQRLSPIFIQSRTIPFVGVGSYNVLQDVVDKNRYRLGIRLGLGRISDEYAPMVATLIQNDSEKYDGIYLRADYTHRLTDMLRYRQEFNMKRALDATNIYGLTTIPQAGLDEQKAIILGTTKRYDWRWTNSLEFSLNQYVGFLIQYAVAFDNNPWPVAAKRDTEFLTGFKFAY